MTWCFHCKKESLTDRDHTSGTVWCVDCGRVLIEVEYVDTAEYVDKATFVGYAAPVEGAHLAGDLVRIQKDCSKSHRRTLKKGCDVIYQLIEDHGIADVYHATMYYKIAVEHGFTRGRKTAQVAAACLYVACRKLKKPILLIEFSWDLCVSVYVLGTLYLQLCKLLSNQDPIFLEGVDASLFTHRCTSGLMKDGDVKEVVSTALHLAVSMRKDWIKTNFDPRGIRAAAIYVSCVLHGYNFSNKYVTEEFTREMQRYVNDLKMTKAVCQYNSDAIHSGFGLCKDCYLAFCGGLDGSQLPAFQCAEVETVHSKNGNMKDICTSKNNERDTLSFTDVSEIARYLADEEESRLKIIWGHMNPEHTGEETAAATNQSSDTRKMYKLISQVVARKKEKDKRKGEFDVCQHFDKRLSSKINYDVLARLFGDEEPKNSDNDGSSASGIAIASEENNTLGHGSCAPSWFDHLGGPENAPPHQLSKTPRFPLKRLPCRDQNQAQSPQKLSKTSRFPLKQNPRCHQNQAPIMPIDPM